MNVSRKMCAILTAALMVEAPALTFAEQAAPAATLVRVEGNVMVNQGVKYAMATPGTELRPGTKVVTAKGASVAIVYKGGCIKQLKENSMLTVGLPSECAAGKANERAYVAEAVGETATDAPTAAAGSSGAAGPVAMADPITVAAAGTAGISSGFIVAGVVAAGAATAVATNNDHNASAQ